MTHTVAISATLVEKEDDLIVSWVQQLPSVITNTLKSYVDSILSDPWSSQDLENSLIWIWEKIEYLRPYVDMLNDVVKKRIEEEWFGRKHKLYSYQFVENIIFDQTPEDFETMLQDKIFQDNLLYQSEQKLTDCLIPLCKNKQDVISLFLDSSVKTYLLYISAENIKLIIWLCKNVEDFLSLFHEIYLVLNNAKTENLRFILDWYDIKTPDELIWICKETWVSILLEWAENENLQYITYLYNLDAFDFHRLCNSNNVRKVLQYWKTKNLREVWPLCRSLSNFRSLCNSKEGIDSLIKLDYELLKYRIDYYCIQNWWQLESILSRS